MSRPASRLSRVAVALAALAVMLLGGNALAAQASAAPTIAALRAGDFSNSQSVFVEGYYMAGDLGSGRLVMAPDDHTSADNSCTIFTDKKGDRFYREVTAAGYFQAAWCGALPSTGINPSKWRDETKSLVLALNAAAGRPVSLACGAFKITGDLDALTAANNIDLIGCQPAMIELLPPFTLDPAKYLIQPYAGGSYSETPTHLAIDNYTVLFTRGSGTFGSPDSKSAFGYGAKLRHLANVIMWADGPGAQMAIHQRCSQMLVEDSTFVLYSFIAAVMRGGGDNCNWQRTAFLDDGWNTPGSGVFGINPTYGSGVAILWASTGNPASKDYQIYFGNAVNDAPLYYTQASMTDTYVWVRNDTLDNKSGYRALQLDAVGGDLKFTRFQATTGVLAYQSMASFEQSHIESFAKRGTSASSDSDLYAAYFYDSQISLLSGWLGAGYQLHSGPHAASMHDWIYEGGSGNYSATHGPPMTSINLAPGHPGTSGTAWRGGVLSPICRMTNKGVGGSEDFIWSSVLPDEFGFNGIANVAIQLQADKAAYRAQIFELFLTKEGKAYANSAQPLAPSLGGGDWDVTFSVSAVGDNTTTGRSLALNVHYTGKAWTTGTPVCVTANLDGNISSSD